MASRLDAIAYATQPSSFTGTGSNPPPHSSHSSVSAANPHSRNMASHVYGPVTDSPQTPLYHVQHNQSNSLGYPSTHSIPTSFNPQQISLDIRTPEELAAINQFLVTLGKEVILGTPSPPDLHAVKQEFSPSHNNSGAPFDPRILVDSGFDGAIGLDTTYTAKSTSDDKRANNGGGSGNSGYFFSEDYGESPANFHPAGLYPSYPRHQYSEAPFSNSERRRRPPTPISSRHTPSDEGDLYRNDPGGSSPGSSSVSSVSTTDVGLSLPGGIPGIGIGSQVPHPAFFNTASRVQNHHRIAPPQVRMNDTYTGYAKYQVAQLQDAPQRPKGVSNKLKTDSSKGQDDNPLSNLFIDPADPSLRLPKLDLPSNPQSESQKEDSIPTADSRLSTTTTGQRVLPPLPSIPLSSGSAVKYPTLPPPLSLTSPTRYQFSRTSSSSSLSPAGPLKLPPIPSLLSESSRLIPLSTTTREKRVESDAMDVDDEMDDQSTDTASISTRSRGRSRSVSVSSSDEGSSRSSTPTLTRSPPVKEYSRRDSSSSQRQAHMKVVRDLLDYINKQYQGRFKPSAAAASSSSRSPPLRAMSVFGTRPETPADVEMK